MSIGVRTKEIGAKEDKDFYAIAKDKQALHFRKNESHKIVKIEIIDDEQWNEDREFHVELYDLEFGNALPEIDCKTIVLIIDDDKPGNLAFMKKGQIRHVSTEESLTIAVERVGGADGEISCKFKTR